MAEENSGERQAPDNVDHQCVVDVFVKKYYAFLENCPNEVHKFYKDISEIKRLRPDGVMESVKTMKDISDTIMSSDYKGCSADILSADFQESADGGIIVAVNGYLTLNDNLRKSFYQTFFLAKQERGFFVLNDILRFTDVAHKESTPSASSDTTKSSSSVPLIPVPETAPIPDSTNASVVEDDIKKVVPEVKDDTKRASVVEDIKKAPEVNVDIKKAPEVKVDAKKAPEMKDDTKKAPKVKESIPVSQTPKELATLKTSYASMVAKPSNVTAPPPTVVVKISSTAEQQPKASTVVKSYVNPTNNAAKGLNSINNGTENSSINGDAMSRSVYIGNLPANITKNALIDALKEFGRAKPESVQLKSYEDGFCFGFVEFESASAAQKAVEVHNYNIGGKDSYITVKRSNNARSGEFHGNGVNGHRQNGENNFNTRNQFPRNDKRSNGEAYPRQKDDRLVNGGDGFQVNNQRRTVNAVRT